ncbi:hypothetical protein K7432_001348 [Basidiobolus ranarum]|uniref:SET domain-containing protein n=1 Tax=Basidiobolus ranarum TaxID=34480 RepID=A0ABR2X372_9FUNG
MSRKNNLPAGWPSGVTYIPTSVWANNTTAEVKEKYKPIPSKVNTHIPDPTSYFQVLKQHEITPDGRKTKIKAITDPEHPCCGAFGLFAACNFEPKQHVVDYCGYIHLSEDGETDPEIQSSDYVLRFTTELSIDAGRQGNEGRFVNDFRGVPKEPSKSQSDLTNRKNKDNIRGQSKGKDKKNGNNSKSHSNETNHRKNNHVQEKTLPNVHFVNYLDERTKEVRIGIFTIRKIRKGDEFLISYGKSFWQSRLGSVPSAFVDVSYE